MLHHARSPRSEHDYARQLHPSSITVFKTHGETFLVAGFRGDGSQHDIASLLYKLDTENSLQLPGRGRTVAGSGFEFVLSVPSVGVVDVEYVPIRIGFDSNGDPLYRDILLIANGLVPCCSFSLLLLATVLVALFNDIQHITRKSISFMTRARSWQG